MDGKTCKTTYHSLGYNVWAYIKHNFFKNVLEMSEIIIRTWEQTKSFVLLHGVISVDSLS